MSVKSDFIRVAPPTNPEGIALRFEEVKTEGRNVDTASRTCEKLKANGQWNVKEAKNRSRGESRRRWMEDNRQDIFFTE